MNTNNSRLLYINTMRTLAIDAIQKANSGHPGAAMAMAPVAFTLWDKFIRHNPANPVWSNRDRFVLSAGHASMLLYSLLHIMGYEISLNDIKNFRQLNGICAGHPEYGEAPGVEVTTGPLAQGAGASVGMAIAEKYLKSRYNKPGFDIVDHKIYALLGDGCMMEGLSTEAASLAGHLNLNNLVWIYDNNHITIEGETSLAFSEKVAQKYEALSWEVYHVDDANDTDALSAAFNQVQKQSKPALIIVDSHIAYGSPNKHDTAAAHGAPLGEDEVKLTKQNYGWDPDKYFYVPREINSYQEEQIRKGKNLEDQWHDLFDSYQKEYPDLAQEFKNFQNNKLPANWDNDIPEFPADEKGMATRGAGGKVLNAIAAHIPWLIGGSADLGPSNKTLITDESDFSKDNYSARNLRFGVREHAMAAVSNGLAISKLRPYTGTFLVFSDYMRPSIRLAAMMNLPVIYVFTHDSIGVGEDGPTHQPVEHLAALRAIPNLDVMRPADSNEVAVLWKLIMEIKNNPVALVLSRQNLPVIDRSVYSPADGAARGAYILADSDKTPEILLISSGSEVHICLEAFEQLKQNGVDCRVVSMPSWRVFEKQDDAYKEKVLPQSIKKRIVVEAGSSMGWERYAGQEGIILGMDQFGKSAPYKELMREFGFTAEHIVEVALKML